MKVSIQGAWYKREIVESQKDKVFFVWGELSSRTH